MNARRGMTLVELALSLSLAVGIGGTVYVASSSMTSAFRLGGAVARLDSQAHDALLAIAGRIEAAGPATLVPLLADPNLGETEVRFERVVGYADGLPQHAAPERIAYEPSPTDPPDGLDNDGNGLVDDGLVVWTERVGGPDENRHVLARQVAGTLEGELAGNGLDDNGNGLVDEGGFALWWDGRTVTVRLCLEARVGRNRSVLRSFERTAAFGNAAP